ncbi:MAG: triose-phosphate isomerase [Clostridia bacterium]|nr:triose-phosphate isomerase [Clostridia bacterium]
MRKTIIAGNWKMNKTPSEAAELAAAIAQIQGAKCEVVICPPFVDLFYAKKAIEGSCVKLGAQNCHFKESGAFTGEISADMLIEAGCEYVIIGHSERRQYFAETDETVNLRTKAALAKGLKVIVCVGETREERENGITENVIDRQIRLGLKDLSKEEMANVVIAYEPVWAIGTGLTATNEQAEEVCKFIRGLIAKLFDADVAEETTIQYGGSMNAGNCAALLAMPNIDGGLIGGAALKPADFATIIAAGSAN